MQEGYGCEAERETSNAEGRDGVPVVEADEHGGEDQDGPGAAEGYEGDADAVPAWRRRRKIVDSEDGHSRLIWGRTVGVRHCKSEVLETTRRIKYRTRKNKRSSQGTMTGVRQR